MRRFTLITLVLLVLMLVAIALYRWSATRGAAGAFADRTLPFPRARTPLTP